MADQMINGLQVKTNIQAGDKALISGVAEEYLICLLYTSPSPRDCS